LPPPPSTKLRPVNEVRPLKSKVSLAPVPFISWPLPAKASIESAVASKPASVTADFPRTCSVSVPLPPSEYVELAVLAAHLQEVVAFAAVQDVVALAAVDDVAAAEAGEIVVALVAGDGVGRAGRQRLPGDGVGGVDRVVVLGAVDNDARRRLPP